MPSNFFCRKFLSGLLPLWCLGLSWGLMPLHAARAATLSVTTLADHDDGACTDSDCTLREALAYATTGSTLTFASGVSGTLTLGRALTITQDVTIIGPPAGVTLSGNDAVPVLGVTGGTVTLKNLTIAHGLGAYGSTDGSTASAGGAGGLGVSGGNLTLSGCTIASNVGGAGNNSRSTGDHPTKSSEGGPGGMSVSGSASVTLINCTLAQNAGGSGGNGYNYGLFGISKSKAGGTGGVTMSSGMLNMNNSTVASNVGGIGGVMVSQWTVGSTHADSGVNDFSRSDGSAAAVNTIIVKAASESITSETYSLINTDPQLGSLQNNGGPTQTMALLSGSPALNAGDPNFDTASTPYDQRGIGYARVYGGRVDIGAYEAQTITVTVSGKVYNAVALSGLSGIVIKAERQSDGAVFAVGTQNDGTYRLALNLGTYTFSAFLPHKPGFIINPAFANPVTLTGTPATLSNYNFRAVGVTGRVISPANVGISSVMLNLYAQNDTALKSPLRTSTTDSNGFFSLDGVAAGTYLVAPVAPTAYTYTPTTRTVTVVDKAVFTSFTARVKSATKSINSVRSAVVLSTANADVSKGALTLKFTGSLDATSVAELAHYIVEVDGISISMETARLSGTDTLVLTLPTGALAPAESVSIAWHSLLDTQGLPVHGETILILR